ncbi:unnamed protein product [Fasciola hepatica]|uniref:Farnesyl pyrophosphate synthase n=1 Tax=Fasciola hepatica TaxID=6192 RepID=A0ABC9HHD3_FASHE
MLSSMLDEFQGYYGLFIEEIDKLQFPEDEKGYFKTLINYNISGGKRIRGALVPAAMEAFKSKQSTRKCHVREAHLIGWCIELIHAGFLVLDDIMDDSPVRRGKPSWFHTQQAAGYGLISVNDGIHLILTAKFLLYSIFDKSAENDTVLLRIIRLFDEVCYKTCWGQNLDTIYSQTMRSTAADSTTNVDLDKYTWKNYEKITRWKTGFYTFYLPVACGMALAGIQEASCYDQAANILLKLGQYFQAQSRAKLAQTLWMENVHGLLLHVFPKLRKSNFRPSKRVMGTKTLGRKPPYAVFSKSWACVMPSGNTRKICVLKSSMKSPIVIKSIVPICLKKSFSCFLDEFIDLLPHCL